MKYIYQYIIICYLAQPCIYENRPTPPGGDLDRVDRAVLTGPCWPDRVDRADLFHFFPFQMFPFWKCPFHNLHFSDFPSQLTLSELFFSELSFFR